MRISEKFQLINFLIVLNLNSYDIQFGILLSLSFKLTTKEKKTIFCNFENDEVNMFDNVVCEKTT